MTESTYWAPAEAFAELAGISPQAARTALRRAIEGYPWRGHALVVRHRLSRRGLEVRLSSLPTQLQTSNGDRGNQAPNIPTRPSTRTPSELDARRLTLRDALAHRAARRSAPPQFMPSPTGRDAVRALSIAGLIGTRPMASRAWPGRDRLSSARRRSSSPAPSTEPVAPRVTTRPWSRTSPRLSQGIEGLVGVTRRTGRRPRDPPAGGLRCACGAKR